MAMRVANLLAFNPDTLEGKFITLRQGLGISAEDCALLCYHVPSVFARDASRCPGVWCMLLQLGQLCQHCP